MVSFGVCWIVPQIGDVYGAKAEDALENVANGAVDDDDEEEEDNPALGSQHIWRFLNH